MTVSGLRHAAAPIVGACVEKSRIAQRHALLHRNLRRKRWVCEGRRLTLATVHNNNRLPLKGCTSTLGGTYAAIGGHA